MNNYCIYFHFKKDTQQIFYVGIGIGKRPYDKGNRRSKWWNSVYKTHGVDVEIIKRKLSKDEAVELEKWFIKIIGRKDKGEGSLINMTDGGEGWSIGQKHSEESKQKMKEVQKGHKPSRTGPHSPEAVKKMTSNRKKVPPGTPRRKPSDETRRKMSESAKGHAPTNTKPMTEERKLKLALSRMGKIPWNKGKEYSTGLIPWNKGKKYSRKDYKIIE